MEEEVLGIQAKSRVSRAQAIMILKREQTGARETSYAAATMNTTQSITRERKADPPPPPATCDDGEELLSIRPNQPTHLTRMKPTQAEEKDKGNRSTGDKRHRSKSRYSDEYDSQKPSSSRRRMKTSGSSSSHKNKAGHKRR